MFAAFGLNHADMVARLREPIRLARLLGTPAANAVVPAVLILA
jgi:hypothetical protein